MAFSSGLVEGLRRKEIGISRALSKEDRAEVISYLRNIAVKAIRELGEVTVDDVLERAEKDGVEPEYIIKVMGKAMGGLFRGRQFVFTGRTDFSRRPQNHANILRIWTLRSKVHE